MVIYNLIMLFIQKIEIFVYWIGDKILLVVDVGDVYYDLSKMYGGILMSYKLMKDSSNFSCYVDGDMVTYDYKSESKLDDFKVVYERWIIDNEYDLDKVKTITSLIFLNMAPLHEKEFGDLLFFKSKEMIQELND